jgi:hypothetical protein
MIQDNVHRDENSLTRVNWAGWGIRAEKRLVAGQSDTPYEHLHCIVSGGSERLRCELGEHKSYVFTLSVGATTTHVFFDVALMTNDDEETKFIYRYIYRYRTANTKWACLSHCKIIN